MPFVSLVPEVLQRISAFLIPPTATYVFDEEFGDDSAKVWEFDGRELPSRDSCYIMRDVRSLSGTCRATRAALSAILRTNVRIVHDDMLTWDLGSTRHLQLLPTSFILDTQGQIDLLSKMRSEQLVTLALAVFPYVLIDNLARGFGDSDPYEDIFSQIVRLRIPNIRLFTNVIGLSPSFRRLETENLEIDDQGFWDGGRSGSYTRLASTQHETMKDTLGRLSLKSLTYRRKVIAHRPWEYAFYDFSKILRAAGPGLINLETLSIRNLSVSDDILTDIFQSCKHLHTLIYYPPSPHQLPKVPPGLRTLRTNCSLPPEADAIPPKLEELSVRRDGPLISSPPDDYVPMLPVSIENLHSHIAPGVALGTLTHFIGLLANLRDLEILVLPLPWAECDCSAEDDYAKAFVNHRSIEHADLGWTKEVTIPALIALLLPRQLVVLTINHDHHLSTHPFPDIQHLGQDARDNAGIWWTDNKVFYAEQAALIFAGLSITTLRWRVCSLGHEAWISWERGDEGILLVEAA